MQTILRFINVILTTYMILLFIRIILTWFQGPSMGRPVELLRAVTDPYLNYFRRFRFLQIGRMDFSPLLGFIVLGVLQNITRTLATYGKITFGVVLAIILSGLWSALSFVLIFFCILTTVRAIMYLVGANAYSHYAQILDNLTEPLSDWVRKLFFRQKFMPPNKMMMITAGFLIAGTAVSNILMRLLTGYLAGLPF